MNVARPAVKLDQNRIDANAQAALSAEEARAGFQFVNKARDKKPVVDYLMSSTKPGNQKWILIHGKTAQMKVWFLIETQRTGSQIFKQSFRRNQIPKQTNSKTWLIGVTGQI
jgi:hypothetical protein